MIRNIRPLPQAPSSSGRTSVSRSAARRAPASRARSPLPTQRGHGDEDRRPVGGEGGLLVRRAADRQADLGGRRAALCEVLGEGDGYG
ncbi:hypothetical protein [Streptomyces sp. NPDC058086]|uniref:hypothetical protein n=1 Tax=Streptomyces sp. NPDC058086 TaxID=3346334 RepID=UPI0036E99397